MAKEIEQKYIINSINSSELIHEPFAHKIVRNVFSDNYYQSLLKFLPSKDKYIPIVDTGSVSRNYSPERYVFSFTKENLNKLSKEQKNFFIDLEKILFSGELFHSVTKMFESVLKNRIKNFSKKEIEMMGVGDFKIQIRTLLVKDYTNYSLGAHTDAERKLLSFLFYLPKNDELKNVGTSLYKAKERIDEKDISKHFSLQETQAKFTKVKTCTFLPNSVFIFPRTTNSFHGVEEINIEKKERNLLLLNYYLDKN